MGPQKPPVRIRWLLVVLAVAAIAGAAVAVADPDESRRALGRSPGVAVSAGEPGAAGEPSKGTSAASNGTPVATTSPCGPATAKTVAAVEAHVARRIYAGEAGSHQVSTDRARIAASPALLSALAAGDRPAVYAAVHAIVYTPHWHIVRLRAVRDGRVLADVGGPYVIAPVGGALRQAGRKVGSFVMSVQDDVGYVKLVTRFTGVPVDLYGTPRPPGGFVLGTLRPAPALPRDGATVEVGGVGYLARVIAARAFPDGPLKAVLLFPPPARFLTARSCNAVRAVTWESVLEHIAARLAPLPSHYQELAGTVKGATGGLVFVRIGSRQIAGLSRGPRRLPQSGPVRYRGRTWQVLSWAPDPPARVYFLAPW